MNLEGVEELHQDIILSLLASLNIGVLLSVVGLSDVVNAEYTATILVHDLESTLCDIGTELVHLSSDTAEELLVVNAAAAITIKNLEEALSILFVEIDPEVTDCLLEFVEIKVSGVVIISNFELLAETNDTTSTTCSKLCSELLNNLLVIVRQNGLSLGSRLASSENIVACGIANLS